MQFDFPNEEGKPYKSSGGALVKDSRTNRLSPENWNVKSISEIEGNIITGKTPSTSNEANFGGEIPFITIDDIRKAPFIYMTERTLTEKGANSQSNKFLPEGSLCCSCIGTTGIIGFVGKRGQTNQQINTIVFEDDINKEFLYFSLNLYFQFAKAKTGNILPNMNKEEFSNILFVYPSKDVLQRFHTIASALFSQINNNVIELNSLIKQRDELLPLLMNGQVSLNSDLSSLLLYYREYPINQKTMKENIIQAIVADMQRDLDCRQMARLKAVLFKELRNVEITEKHENQEHNKEENTELLDSFLSAKKIEGCSEKTLAYYRHTIEKMLSKVSVAICHISTMDIRQYLSSYQEVNSSSKVTIDNMRRIFSSFFAWLEDEDYIAKSPVRRIHKVKTDSLVKEVLTDEQLEQLRDNCKNRRDLAMIDLLASTGIRVGELVKLNRADIDFHERQCVVFGKGNKERLVYFNARTKLHLQQYLTSRTDNNPALFVSLTVPYNRLTISGVEVRIRTMGKLLNLPKVHPHKFRRTLATMAIDKGMPIEQVQRLLGHVRIDTTLQYAIVNQNNVKMAHKKYLG